MSNVKEKLTTRLVVGILIVLFVGYLKISEAGWGRDHDATAADPITISGTITYYNWDASNTPANHFVVKLWLGDSGHYGVDSGQQTQTDPYGNFTISTTTLPMATSRVSACVSIRGATTAATT